MQRVYALDEAGKRKLKYLYRQSGINNTVLNYSRLQFACRRLAILFTHRKPGTFSRHGETYAMVQTARSSAFSPGHSPVCRKFFRYYHSSYHGKLHRHECPGLELELMELLRLPATVFHTSVNFMGCYAAIHALKIADAFCKADKTANVLIVCTELCTLHFQKENTADSITSSMLFADGAAAVLVTGDTEKKGLSIDHFYSTVAWKGKNDMAWQLSSKGFLMTLSGYVPELSKRISMVW